MSPDYDGAVGDCDTGTTDFVAFGTQGWFLQEPCFDTSGDGEVSISDFIAFGSIWATNQGCIEMP